MKSRIGFVSNSSSTSFVVTLPDNFNIKDIDWSKIKKDLFLGHDRYRNASDEIKIKDAEKLVKRFIKDGVLYDSREYYDDEESDLEGISVYAVRNALKDFVILEFAGESEGINSIHLLDKKKVKKIWEGK